MNKWLIAFVASLGLLTVGCASSSLSTAAEQANRKLEQQGSPLRWEVENLGGGNSMLRAVLAPELQDGDSRATPELKDDILNKIAAKEATVGRGAPRVSRVKLMKDGDEVWLLDSDKDGIAYVVRLSPAADGGAIVGPLLYSK
jgi:hypothetical protein